MTRRRRSAALLLALSAAAMPAVAGAPDVPAFARQRPRVRAGEPILRFNGKDLAGFYTYTKAHGYEDPRRVVGVVDGQVRVSGEDWGGFATGGNSRDYQLIVEWKWGAATWAPRKARARDSGILLHCVGPDGAAGGQWMESIECQIIEGGCGDFLMVAGRGRPRLTCETRLGPDGQLYYEQGGRAEVRDRGRFNWWGRDPGWTDTLGIRGPRDVERPAGDWNRMELICDGDTITAIVNGYVVNVGTHAGPTEGKIQFQSEGAEIFFRTIEVRPLLR